VWFTEKVKLQRQGADRQSQNQDTPKWIGSIFEKGINTRIALVVQSQVIGPYLYSHQILMFFASKKHEKTLGHLRPVDQGRECHCSGVAGTLTALTGISGGTKGSKLMQQTQLIEAS